MWLVLLACAPAADVAPPAGAPSVVIATYTWGFDGLYALPGASVAVDRADGARVEAVTDANGKALLSDIGDGPYALVATDGAHAVSFTGIDAADLADLASDQGYVPIGFPGDPGPPPQTASLAGTITGFTKGASLVAGAHPLGRSDFVNEAFSFDVPVGASVDVVAFGFHDPPTRRTETSLERVVEGIGVARAVGGDPALTVSPLPASELRSWASQTDFRASDFFYDAIPLAFPTSDETSGGLMYGVATFTDLVGGSLVWEGTYHRLDTVRSPVTRYRFEGRDRLSVVDITGWPEDGALTLQWVEPPDAGRSWDPSGPLDLDVTAEDLSDPSLSLSLYVYGPDDAIVWSAWFVSGTASPVMPALPGGVATAAVIPDGSVARPVLAGRLPEDRGWRYGVGPVLRVSP